jgi:hypothetical protein
VGSTLLKWAGYPQFEYQVAVAALTGAAGLAVCLWLEWQLITRPKRFNKTQVVLQHVMIFLALSACAVGVGRVWLPPIESVNSRYTTPALLYWACLLILVWALVESRWRRILEIGLVVAVMGMALHQRNCIRWASGYAAEAAQAEMAIVAGVPDPDAWRLVYGRPELIADTIAWLRRERLTIFAEEWTQQMEAPLAAHYAVSTRNSCRGGVSLSLAVPGAGRRCARPGTSRAARPIRRSRSGSRMRASTTCAT